MAIARGLILSGVVTALAACSGGGGEGSQASQSSQAVDANPVAAGANRVSCAIAGAQAFADSCTLEQAQVEGAPILVVRHADGGFHRFAVKEGSVTEADGAEKAVVARSGSMIDVSVGSDRYRLDASQLNAR